MISPAHSAKTILVVEDDDLTREGFAVILRRAGYQVLLAANSVAAVNLLGNGASHDLILLDMMMPVADGWLFLKMQREHPLYRAIPVLLATALRVASKDWALSLGACDVLHKPIVEDDLLEAIQTYCPASRTSKVPG